MVLQQKVKSATKNISKKAVQSLKSSMFELDTSDEDNDDLDIEMDSIVVQAKTCGKQTLAKQTPNKLTPAKLAPGKKTPVKQTPGKKTPVKQTPGKKTPAQQTPGKKTPAQQTPGKQTPAQQTPGKQTPAQQTPGKQTPAQQTPGKQTPAQQTPGKQTPAQQTPAMKMNNEVENDDDEEDEVEDEEDDADEEDDDEEDDDVDDEEVSTQNFTIGCNQNLQQVENNTPVKKEASRTIAIDFSLAKQNEKRLAILQENKIRRDLHNARCLILRYLPVDVTLEEVKSLSDDIIDVNFQDPEVIKRKYFKSVFVFVEFASEEKAVENYAALQNQMLRGKPINVDYARKKLKAKELFNTLRVCGLPINIKITQIAKLTPNATSIKITFLKSDRVAMVTFDSEEEAAEAFEANGETKINGISVTFLYSMEIKKPI